MWTQSEVDLYTQFLTVTCSRFGPRRSFITSTPLTWFFAAAFNHVIHKCEMVFLLVEKEPHHLWLTLLMACCGLDDGPRDRGLVSQLIEGGL